jgi:hypothetical protein
VAVQETSDGDQIRRRGVSLDPFFDRLERVFEIEPACMKGLANNRSMGVVLGRIFATDASPSS